MRVLETNLNYTDCGLASTAASSPPDARTGFLGRQFLFRTNHYGIKVCTKVLYKNLECNEKLKRVDNSHAILYSDVWLYKYL